MAKTEIVIELGSQAFKDLMLEAFEKAGRITVQRMVELASPEHKSMVQELGARCLAELEE
jgi:predicted HTH domain antitoxin